MSATFVYIMFLSLAVVVIGMTILGYFYSRKIKKVKVNPLNIILGSFLLMALWLFDLTTLGISENGLLETTYGVAPGATRVPGYFIWLLVFVGMLAINIYYYFQNERNKSNLKSYHHCIYEN